MPRTVLFLCTGNYYRSRFAEELFNDSARRAGLDWTATSRGLALELGPVERRPAVGPLAGGAGGPRAAVGRAGPRTVGVR